MLNKFINIYDFSEEMKIEVVSVEGKISYDIE